MTVKARLAVSLAAVAVAAYGFGPLPHGNVPVAASGPVTYQFNPSPIAPAGTLAKGSTVSVTLTATDSSGPVSGATVYLAFVAGHDSTTASAVVAGQCGATSTSLNSTAKACTTDVSGTIVITYLLSATGNPPTGGHDKLTAGATPTSVDASTFYYYGTVKSYAFQYLPLADAGNLASGHPVTFTVTAKDGNGGTVAALPNGLAPNIWVEFKSTTSPATATLHQTSCTSTPGYSTTATSVPSSGGSITLCFQGPTFVLPITEVDTVTVSDSDDTSPDVVAQDGYNAAAASALNVTPSPIASAGTLTSGGPAATVKYTVDGSSSNALQWACVTLSIQSQPGGGAPIGTAKVGSITLANAGKNFVTDANGQVTMDYTAGTSPNGSDEVSAKTYTTNSSATGPCNTALTPSTNDYYNYSQVTHYTLTDVTGTPQPLSTPIAPDTSLSAGSSKNITITALDATNTAVPNAVVKLAFNPANGDSTHNNKSTLKVVDPVTSTTTNVTSAGAQFTTDSNGQITGITYKLGSSPIPLGGKDVITVSQNDGTDLVTDYYKFDALASYTPSPAPIAPLGTLAQGSSVNVSILQSDTSTPDTSTPMWLVFNAATGGGTANVTQCTDGSGSTVSTLGSTAAECFPDGSGVVHVNYQTPSTLPAGGGDVLKIGDDSSIQTNSASAAVTSGDSYTYAGTYVFSPSGSIAPAGTLAPGSNTPITVTVDDTQGNPAPSAAVDLSMTSAPGGGTATANGLVLTSTPQQFTADNAGHVSIQYTVADPPAGGGTDTITAQNAPTSPSVSSSVTYSYVSSYTFTPAPPIAPAASLGPNTLRQITVTANDSNGSPAPGALAFVSFSQTAGGGTATVNGVALNGTPQQVAANGSGQFTVSYTTPGTLPSSGVDSIVVGNALSSPTVAAADSYSYAPIPTQGYWMVASDGGIFSFGLAHFHGSTGAMRLNKPIVAMAPTPSGNGYWLVASDGGIFTFGDAGFHGSTGAMTLNKPIVGMASTPSGNGYWLVASDGGIFAFGDAGFHGSTGAMTLNKPIVGMASTPSGNGYWLVASDGGIFAFGDAGFHGSTGAIHLNQPIVGMAATHDGNGYWMVASDGGIFSFGDAGFHGSTGNIHLNQPIVGMAATHDDGGYWMVASDGGIFAFDDAHFYGSEGGTHLNQPIVGMAGIG